MCVLYILVDLHLINTVLIRFSIKDLPLREKVRVSCLCPSFAPTDLFKRGLEEHPEMKEFVDKLGMIR